eukprot:18174_1
MFVLKSIIETTFMVNILLAFVQSKIEVKLQNGEMKIIGGYLADGTHDPITLPIGGFVRVPQYKVGIEDQRTVISHTYVYERSKKGPTLTHSGVNGGNNFDIHSGLSTWVVGDAQSTRKLNSDLELYWEYHYREYKSATGHEPDRITDKIQVKGKQKTVHPPRVVF